MTATNETYLPTYEDLYVPPLNLTSPALRAGAFYFAQFCDTESKVFIFIILFVFIQLLKKR